MAEQFFLRFVKKEQLNHDTYSFYFDRVKQDSVDEVIFDFLPGQYIRMTLPHENPDERGTSRFFTIASSPLDEKYIILTIKIIQSTFKKKLITLVPGQKVQFWGPIGQFVLPENTTKPLVFLAGGIGVTPYYSMILYAYKKNLNVSMTLFVSFSSYSELVYYDELSDINKQNENIDIIYTISDSIDNAWKGERGRISEELLKKYLRNVKENIYFIAGSSGMVTSMEQLLKTMGVEESSIIKETYPGY